MKRGWPRFVNKPALLPLALQNPFGKGFESIAYGVRPLSRLVAAAVEHTNPVCGSRSEEHTSELQSRRDLVCRLLLEKKKKIMKESACSAPICKPSELPTSLSRTSSRTSSNSWCDWKASSTDS